VAAPVQLVTITLRAEPANVQLKIDDGPQLPNPQIITTSPNPKLHSITASLEGYESQTRQLVFDHNQEIFLGLKQLTPAPTTSGGKTTPNAQRPVATDSVDIRNIKPKRTKRTIDPSNPFAE
jgi:hypothetical protein